MATLPENMLATYASDALTGNLYPRKIGYFPHAKYHHVQKDNGCHYALLIHCTGGSGWLTIQGVTMTIEAHQYIILPPDTPYSFGTDNERPWTIYWVQFCGKSMPRFLDPHTPPHPRSVSPGDCSRLQERTRLFQDMYSSFSMAYTRDYMAYSCLCLYHYLGSFIFLEQYRNFMAPVHKAPSLIDRIMHYMNENIAESLTLSRLAAYFKYSPTHLSALFRRQTGMSPINCFLRMKIQKACLYLELSDMKIHEISAMLGFTDPAYFSRLFRKSMGVSPQNYRESERNLTPQTSKP